MVGPGLDGSTEQRHGLVRPVVVGQQRAQGQAGAAPVPLGRERRHEVRFGLRHAVEPQQRRCAFEQGRGGARHAGEPVGAMCDTALVIAGLAQDLGPAQQRGTVKRIDREGVPAGPQGAVEVGLAHQDLGQGGPGCRAGGIERHGALDCGPPLSQVTGLGQRQTEIHPGFGVGRRQRDRGTEQGRGFGVATAEARDHAEVMARPGDVEAGRETALEQRFGSVEIAAAETRDGAGEGRGRPVPGALDLPPPFRVTTTFRSVHARSPPWTGPVTTAAWSRSLVRTCQAAIPRRWNDGEFRTQKRRSFAGRRSRSSNARLTPEAKLPGSA